MLIRLLSVPPHPTILFAVTFPNLPHDLPLPWAWSNQLHSLSLDDLEIPQLLQCLDSATALSCLLQEVTFDLPLRSISCRFIDGSLEQWALSDGNCIELLNSVISDVNESSSQIDRQAIHETKSKDNVSTRSEAALNSPPASLKAKGHKKQRSLLMSLVASIVSPSSSRPSSPSSLSSSPSSEESATPVTIPLPQPPARVALKPKALRRRARSTLVDTYRRHVQSELKSRLPTGGFYSWIVQSMLRRNAERLDQLIQSGGIRLSALARRDTGFFSLTESVSSTATPYDEDGDIETDTDGSSVRTPSSFSRGSAADSTSPFDRSRPSSSNIQDALDLSQDANEYKVLASSCLRLRNLLSVAHSRQAHADREQKQRDTMLEIRSRRRAWLNKTLYGNASTSIGLAMPFQSSRLAQASWSADDYEFVNSPVPSPRRRSIEDEEYADTLARGLRRTRGNGDDKLFPLTEEEVEQDGVPAPWRIDDHDEVNDNILRREVGKEPRTCMKNLHERDLDMTPGKPGIISARSPLAREVDGFSYDVCSRSAFLADEFPIDVPYKLQRSLPGRKLPPLVY